MLWTTLRTLREQSACEEGYKKLRKSLPERFGQDEAIPLLHILFSNGMDDTLWALSAVHPDCEAERDRTARLMAADFTDEARPIYEAHHPDDPTIRETLTTVRRFARGGATREELDAAYDAAWAAAAYDAVYDAAYDTIYDAAYDAAVTARAAAFAAARAADRAAARAATNVADLASVASSASARVSQEKIVFEYLSGKRK